METTTSAQGTSGPRASTKGSDRELAKALRRHVLVSNAFGVRVCGHYECNARWPCDAARAAGALEEAQNTIAEMRGYVHALEHVLARITGERYGQGEPKSAVQPMARVRPEERVRTDDREGA